MTKLSLKSEKIGNEGIQVLTASSNYTKLSSLNIEDNDMSFIGVQALVTSPYLTSLMILKIAINGVGDRGIQALANSTICTTLTSLSIGTPNFPMQMLSGGLMRPLKNDTTNGDESVEILARCPNFTSLTELALYSAYISDIGVQSLAISSYLTSLKSLKLRGSNLINITGEALIRNHPISLVKLNINGKDMSVNL